MTPNRALIVGGTSGIGRGIALALAERGDIAVTIAGRSQERGQEIVKELEAMCPSQPHSFRQVNCFDLSDVKKLADTDANLLIMTQGMATIQGYTPTTNGLDQKLQLHYFSRIYLARLMAPKLASSSNGRILTVLSAGIHSKYKNYEKDFDLKESYSVRNAADAAGFYTDAGFESLALEYPDIVVAHAAPGFVNTSWGTEMPWWLRGPIRILQPLGRSPQKCGTLLTTGWISLDSASAGNNFFLLDQDGKLISNGVRHTDQERQEIWIKTLELLPDD